MAEKPNAADEYYPTVSAVVVHGGKTLLVLYEQLGMWLAPHTHMTLNETPLDSAYRQVQTDTGLTAEQLTLLLPYTDNLSLERDTSEGVTQPVPFDIDLHQAGSKGHMHADFAYIFVATQDALPDTLQKQAKWFSAEELEDLVITTKYTVSRATYALQRLANTDAAATKNT